MSAGIASISLRHSLPSAPASCRSSLRISDHATQRPNLSAHLTDEKPVEQYAHGRQLLDRRRLVFLPQLFDPCGHVERPDGARLGCVARPHSVTFRRDAHRRAACAGYEYWRRAPAQADVGRCDDRRYWWDCRELSRSSLEFFPHESAGMSVTSDAAIRRDGSRAATSRSGFRVRCHRGRGCRSAPPIWDMFLS